jgi:hypothetical protein
LLLIFAVIECDWIILAVFFFIYNIFYHFFAFLLLFCCLFTSWCW